MQRRMLLKFTPDEDQKKGITQNHYHGCWKSGDATSQNSRGEVTAKYPEPLFIQTRPFCYKDSQLKLRRSRDRLRFTVGIPIPVRQRFKQIEAQCLSLFVLYIWDKDARFRRRILKCTSFFLHLLQHLVVWCDRRVTLETPSRLLTTCDLEA